MTAARERHTLIKRLLKGGTWALIGKLISGFGAILITALLARMLNPAELGAYFINLTLSYFLGLSICLGIEQAIIRFISESRVHGRESDIRYFIFYGFAIVAVVGAAVAGILLAGLGQVISDRIFHSPLLASIIQYTATLVFLQGLQKLIGEVFRAFEDIASATLFAGTVFGGALSILLHIVVYLGLMVFDQTLNLVEAAQVSLAICLFCLVFGLVLLRIKNRIPGASAAHGVRLRYILKSGFPIFVVNISSMSTGYIDLWIVAALLNEEKVALYAAVTRLIKFMTTCLYMINEFLSPIIAQLKLQHENDQLEWALRTTAAMATLVGLPIFVIFVIFGEYTLTLFFGEYYAAASVILMVLSVAGIVNVVTGSSGQTLIMSGYSRVMMWISVLVSAVTIIGSILIAPVAGLLGVALVLAAAGIMHQILMMLAARHYCQVWTHASFSMGVQALGTLTELFTNKLHGRSMADDNIKKT